jgi:macrodomain Ter protein organizer (MatP/YcbG family)
VRQRGIELVKISMNLPPALWKRLRAKALQEDTTATDIIVRLIKEDLSTPQKKEKP